MTDKENLGNVIQTDLKTEWKAKKIKYIQSFPFKMSKNTFPMFFYEILHNCI